jgi:hypothetical protein
LNFEVASRFLKKIFRPSGKDGDDDGNGSKNSSTTAVNAIAAAAKLTA